MRPEEEISAAADPSTVTHAKVEAVSKCNVLQDVGRDHVPVGSIERVGRVSSTRSDEAAVENLHATEVLTRTGNLLCPGDSITGSQNEAFLTDRDEESVLVSNTGQPSVGSGPTQRPRGAIGGGEDSSFLADGDELAATPGNAVE